MSAYRTATMEQIASEKWPYWIPVRHHFGIDTFGINVWHGREDGSLIPEHDEGDSGVPELYWVVQGHASFTVAGEAIDAPAGTFVWVTDSTVARAAQATADGTLVLSVSGGAPGEAYAPSGWDSHYLESD
ncbi:MAG TPA: hypothetical protein VFJ91_12290 [Gaiellaceae bacterium]|nr:hypothetical protein [Gaiellaceae bacterium]